MALSEHDWKTLSSLLTELGKDCHKRAEDNGFWLHPTPSVGPGFAPASETLEIAAKIALIANEASELLEAWRLADPFGPCPKSPEHLSHFTEEGADILVRLLDLFAHFDLDLAAATEAKLRVNGKRAYKHGKRF